MRILEVVCQTARKVKYIYFYHKQSWYLYGNWIFLFMYSVDIFWLEIIICL